MNIDDYRAMIAQEKEDATHKSEQTQTPNETKPIEKPKEDKPTQENKIETLPDKLTIDGVGEITLDDLLYNVTNREEVKKRLSSHIRLY